MALYVSTVQPDGSRSGEWLACLWQGDLPDSLVLHKWIYMSTDPRTILLVWEGEADAKAWVELNMGEFGSLETVEADDATGGLGACLERDLEGFGSWMRARGTDEDQIQRGLDVRRAGLEAPTREAAIEAGKAWMAGA